MSTSIEYTEEMIAKVNAAFQHLFDKSDTMVVADLAPVVIYLLHELDIPTEAASAAFTRMNAPMRPEPWTRNGRRGKFIVFEGLDRSGKSTQSKLLLAHLQKQVTVQDEGSNRDGDKQLAQGGAKWMCFPARHTPMGALIDLYLRNKVEMPDRAVHLLFSANRWEMADSIVADLNAGCTVVCDRYAFSGVVYSVAKGMDPTWCRAPDVGVPRPDLVFFMHLDPEVGAKRAAFGDERYENTGMQAAVRAEFANADFGAEVSWNPIDGAQEKEVIAQQIQAITNSHRASDKENAFSMDPLEPLWCY